jgi:hypothetical protein
MTTAAAKRADPEALPAGTTAMRSKPGRVTLNIPPELFRQLTRWADSAAVAIDAPSVSVQDALRTMIHVVTDDTDATGKALDRLRRAR